MKLFYLYQRLQCTDNYFFKIEFAFFLYLLFWLYIHESEKHERKTICLDIFLLSDREYLLSGFGFSILQLLMIYRIYDYLICWRCHHNSETPEVACLTFQTSRNEKDGTWSELTWLETTVLPCICVIAEKSRDLHVTNVEYCWLCWLEIHIFFIVNVGF